MNVIAYDAAYSLFPKATFEDRVSLVSATRNDKEKAAIAKYRHRGWTILDAEADRANEAKIYHSSMAEACCAKVD